MTLLDPTLRVSLGALLAGRVCIVGVGNREQGDDGAGPRVVDQRRPGTRGLWIDAGVAPENYLETIAQSHPDTVLFVDTVNFGGTPGQCRLVDAHETDMLVLSTHAGSLSMLADYLTVRTGAKLRVVGIQPNKIALGEALNARVAESVRELAAMLSDLLSPP